MPNASSQTTYNAPARATDVSHSGRECKHRLVIIMKTKRCSCLRLESYYVQVRFFCVCVCWRQFHRFVCFSKHDIATSSPWFETRQKRVLVALAGCICCAHDDLPSSNVGCKRNMRFFPRDLDVVSGTVHTVPFKEGRSPAQNVSRIASEND